jgi:amidase
MNIVVQDVQIGRGALKVMVKDSIDIQGLKTMIGSKALMDKPSATKNAEVVERILAADCQITAKPIYMSWLLNTGSIPFLALQSILNILI